MAHGARLCLTSGDVTARGKTKMGKVSDWLILYAPDIDEWQVSDGPAGERSTSYDFKTREEAEEWVKSQIG